MAQGNAAHTASVAMRMKFSIYDVAQTSVCWVETLFDPTRRDVACEFRTARARQTRFRAVTQGSGLRAYPKFHDFRSSETFLDPMRPANLVVSPNAIIRRSSWTTD